MPGRTQESEEREDYGVTVRGSCTVRGQSVFCQGCDRYRYVPAAADGWNADGRNTTGERFASADAKDPSETGETRRRRGPEAYSWSYTGSESCEGKQPDRAQQNRQGGR